MVSGANVFFNTKIVNNRCCLESTGDIFFSPIRTLFGGRKVVHVDGCFIVPPKEKQSTFVKILKVAAAVIFLVPGFILGVCVKGLAMLRKCVRKSHRDFVKLYNSKTAEQKFITDKKGTYLFIGNRASFKPSIESYQNRYPWAYLDKAIKEPTALHLQHMQIGHVERVLKLSKIDYRSVTMADLRGVNMTEDLLKLLSEKCPNLQTFHFTDLSRVSPDALNKFISDCTRLDQECKDRLMALLPQDEEPSEGDNPLDETAVNVDEVRGFAPDRVSALGITAAIEELTCSEIDNLDSTLFREIMERCGETLLSLDLSGCALLTVEDLKVAFSKCSNLQILNLSGVKALRQEELKLIGSLSKLKALDLSDTLPRITPETIKRMGACKELKTLILGDVKKLTDVTALSLIAKFPNLAHLSLRGCSQITNHLLQQIQEKHQHIKDIDVTGTKINKRQIIAFRRIRPDVKLLP